MTLFIVGFPIDMDEAELAEIFSRFGTVERVSINRNVQTGRSLGYGFLTLPDDAAYAAITDMDGGSIDGRKLTVRRADAPRAQKAYSSKRGSVNKPPRLKRPRIAKLKDE